MLLSRIFYQFKVECSAGKVNKAKQKLDLKGPTNCKPNIVICFKIKFIHNEIKVMNF